MALPNAHAVNHTIRINAAAKIFAEYGSFIRSVIRYHVRDETQVDDLFQDFFLSLIAKPIPQGVQNIERYLYRAISNDVIDAARRVKNYQTHICRYVKSRSYRTIKDKPENTLMKREEIDKMFELIEKLLQRGEAQAVILRYRNQYKIREIAAKMGVSDIAAWRYISKGFRKIRQFLKVRRLQ